MKRMIPIFLEDEQVALLERERQRTGLARAVHVRRAVDMYLTQVEKKLKREQKGVTDGTVSESNQD